MVCLIFIKLLIEKRINKVFVYVSKVCISGWPEVYVNLSEISIESPREKENLEEQIKWIFDDIR